MLKTRMSRAGIDEAYRPELAHSTESLHVRMVDDLSDAIRDGDGIKLGQAYHPAARTRDDKLGEAPRTL